MPKFRSILAVTALSTIATAAVASPATPVVDARQAQERARIAQGVRTGALTPHEAAYLRHGQAGIRRMEAFAKSDGVVTPLERRRLNGALDAQSRQIWRLKHNHLGR
jgi:uncharacterized membrane protein YebE (DUF533 family)